MSGLGRQMADYRKPVYLLAGGRSGSRKTTDSLVRAVFVESGKAAPRVAYVGTASGDDEGFFDRLADVFREVGASEVIHALIYSRKADLRKAREILQSADIVFISGGDVDTGMRALQERDMVGFLSQLYSRGMPFFGLSAGSIMLAKEWVRWRDPDDDSTAELFPCLGFAPIICDTHDEQEGWQELQAALRLERDGVRGYGIASGTALKVLPDGAVEALGGAVHQYMRCGERVERCPDIVPAGI